MAEHLNGAVIHLKSGEDFTGRITWRGDQGQPIPVQAPLRMQVRDTDGQLILNFVDTSYVSGSVVKQGYLLANSNNGHIDIFVPWEVTKQLPAGSYVFDLFVAVNLPGYDNPFENKDASMRKEVVSGRFMVHPRISTIP